MRSADYQEELLKSLRNPKQASAYLNAAIEEKDIQLFLLALRNVIEAYGGIAKISKRTKLNRQNLYRILSKKGNPELLSIEALLEAVGLQLAVSVRRKSQHRAA